MAEVLRWLFPARSAKRRSIPRASRPRRCLPTVERLEDRLVPAALFDDFQTNGLANWTASNATLHTGKVELSGPDNSTGSISRAVSGYTGDFTLQVDFTKVTPAPYWSETLSLTFGSQTVTFKNNGSSANPTGSVYWSGTGPTNWPGVVSDPTAGRAGVPQTFQVQRVGSTFYFSVLQAGQWTPIKEMTYTGLGTGVALTGVTLSSWTWGATLNTWVDNFRVYEGGFTNTPIPALARFESIIDTYGPTHGDEHVSRWNAVAGTPWMSVIDPNTSSPYDAGTASTLQYDHTRVYYQIADYYRDNSTGPTSWLTYADAANNLYKRSMELSDWPYTISEPHSNPDGMYMAYLRTGDAQALYDLFQHSERQPYAADHNNNNNGYAYYKSRLVAYSLLSHLDAEELGHDRRTPKTDQLIDWAMGHIDQWFANPVNWNEYMRPFMVGITAEALIRAYDYLPSSDGRRDQILTKLQTAADSLWANEWVEAARAFKYTDVNTNDPNYTGPHADSGGTTPAPDLNNLIAPTYAWLYYQTGDVKYRDRADKIFDGGVNGPYSFWNSSGPSSPGASPKNFGQNFRWVFAYLDYRSRAPLTHQGELFADTFEDGGASWTITTGAWEATAVGGSTLRNIGETISIAVANGTSGTNYTVTAAVRIAATASPTPAGTAQVGGRIQPGSDWLGYYFGFTTESGQKVARLYERVYTGGVYGTWGIGAAVPYNWTADTDYVLRLTLNGTTLTGSISTDGGTTFQTVLTRTNQTRYTSGVAGVRAAHALTNFSDFTVGSVPVAEDFTAGGASWTNSAGTWQATGGQYRTTSTAESIAAHSWAGAADYTVTATVSAPVTSGSVWVGGRIQADNKNGYYLGFNGPTKLALYKRTGTNTMTLIRDWDFPWTANTTYGLRLSMAGSTLTAWVRKPGETTFRFVGTANDTTYTSGKVGLRAYNTNGAAFDNVSVSVPQFSDNFTAGTGNWTTPSGNPVTTSWQANANTRFRSTALGESLARASWAGAANYEVSAAVTPFSTTGGVYLAGRLQSDNYSGYYIGLSTGGTTAKLYKRTGSGTWQQLGGNISIPWTANATYVLRLTMNGNVLTGSVSADGGSTFQSVTATDSSYGSGKIAVRTINTIASFDDVKVSALPSSPLVAAGGEKVGSGGRPVRQSQLQPLVAEAVARWAVAGADTAALAGVQVVLADLAGDLLGVAVGSTIYIDVNAAGHGWFVDRTPADDREFDLQRGPRGIDLLTVLMHELGHHLGLEHADEIDSVMAEVLGAGERRSPTATDLDASSLDLRGFEG